MAMTPRLTGYETGQIMQLPSETHHGLIERARTLDDFAAAPQDLEIWDNVIYNAFHEETANSPQPDELRDVPVTALADLADTVRSTGPWMRYDITATNAPNGKLWFDVLYGLHSASGDTAIEAALQHHVSRIGDTAIGTIVDLGTGTGQTAAIAAPYGHHTIGIDKNASLLQIARDRNPNVHFVQAAITELPLADNSADVITSDGIKYSLPSFGSIRLYREISRVLKQGGVYIDSSFENPDDIAIGPHGSRHADMHPESLKTILTWRAVLQDMIVDTINGRHTLPDSLKLQGEEWDVIKAQFGLSESELHVRGNASFARILQKVE